MKKIKLMIAEDHIMFRDQIARMLNTSRIEVIGQADNGKELIELVEQQLPDVVLLDLRMPVMDGQEVLKVFSERFQSIKTIILSSDYSDYYAAKVIRNGACAYLLKSADFSELVKAIEDVYIDGFYFNGIISQKILHNLKDDKKKLYFLIEDKRFSEREIEVLKLICDEIPIAQIADKLGISSNTVLYHKNNLMEKTSSITIVSLVKYAIKHGIIKNE